MLGSTVALVLVSFVVMMGMLTTLVSNTLMNERIRQDSLATEKLSCAVASFFADGDARSAFDLLQSGAEDAGGRYLLCDAHGKVQIDSHRRLDGSALPLSEVSTALTERKTAARLHEWQQSGAPAPEEGAVITDVVAAPVWQDQQLIGVLVLSSSVDDLLGRVRATQLQMLTLFALVAAVSITIAFFLSQRMTQPIVSLTRSIQKMGAGDLTVRVPLNGSREMRELGRAYNLMAEQLEQLDHSRNQFVSDASHELKTPLTTMKLLLESLLYQPDMPQALQTEFLNDMNHEIDRLTTIITDLLQLTKMDDRSAPLKLAPCDLTALTEETIRSLLPMAEKRGQTLSSDLEKEVVSHVDASKLRQVFYNLTENAMKYTPDGGHIHVTLRKKAKAITWSVRDNGVGIAEKDQQHIFERFYRVDKARSRETGGTGLGLSIVRRMVSLHGGKIDLVSAPGQGSTFTVTLPLASGKEEQA